MSATDEPQGKSASQFGYHAMRIVLFAAACACAVLGMLTLMTVGDRQYRTEAASSEVARSEAQANVLLLMAYSDSDVLTPLARRGVVDLLTSSGVAVDVEYLDAIACPKGSAAYAARAAALGEKLGAESPYHAVICCDDEALAFVEDYHSELLADVPVVFFNVNDHSHAAEAAESGYATGLVEQSDIEGIIALAQALCPGAAKIVAVVDDTPSGAGDRARFEEAAAGMDADVEFVNASALSRADLARRVGAIGDDATVFFLDAFDDASGNAYTRDESARFVAAATSRPVFGIATGGVGQGVVGAAFTDPEAAGRRAAALCVDVLNGTSPADIDLVTEGAGGFAFDAVAMGEHGLSADALPSDAVVINQPAFTWDSIKSMLPAIGLLVLGILLIAAFALMGYRHSVRNMREIMAQSADLRHRFYHDQLTEKHNMQWYKAFMDSPEGSRRVKALVGIDFMSFGDINDSYGRDVGDAVLCELAERFEGIAGKVFLVRSTGSEFLIGFGRTVRVDGSELQGIAGCLADPVVVGDSEIDVDAHIGVANLEDATSFGDMLSGVDLAVRAAKADGASGRPAFYNESMRCAMEERIGITAALKRSIRGEDFEVFYHPQVHLQANAVCGYEALVRLKGDVYYPSQFVPVAEMAGLVIEVDRIVTKKAVQQLAEWKRAGERLVPVSVNYSAVQLKDEGYVDFLIGLLEENDVPASLIKIEITESLLLGDGDSVDELFRRLGEAGVAIALDDFGTGYTSLSWVAGVPAQIVKIDKSIVDDYAVRGKERFLDNLVRLIHDLGKTVVVEGVEDAGQLEICRELGCDIVQGFYFSSPLHADDAVRYVPPAPIGQG